MTEGNANGARCPKCGATFVVPELPPAVRACVSALVRDHRQNEAAIKLSTYGKLGMVNGEAIALHISHARNVCNRCRGPLPELDQCVCPQCGALNLNW